MLLNPFSHVLSTLHVLNVSKTPLEVVLQLYVQYHSVHRRVSSAALGYKIFNRVVYFNTYFILILCTGQARQ